ncbi:MAG: glycerol-3-phosphate acyltransferase [Gammaproteobacteria bacterium RIFCSPHIGHO2_12_FULL_37_34]|nr:MAG: glycerol-3-phosphate acyltransferase [Gammaproteobacteria bacterium RIFCSPHIGHO2_12_FULL_37_34]
MSMEYIETAIALIIAYLVGSLSSAIIVCKLLRLPDPRTQGSNNPGATNVLRIGGKKAALITLFGDVMKGTIPVLLATWYELSAISIAFVACAAFMGHLFPIFFRFQGGKGVATALGCLLALSSLAGLAWMGTWFIVAIIFRYASLSSLVASVLAPLYIWFFSGEIMYTIAVSFMSILLIYRHHRNIANLLLGKENKIGAKNK